MKFVCLFVFLLQFGGVVSAQFKQRFIMYFKHGKINHLLAVQGNYLAP